MLVGNIFVMALLMAKSDLLESVRAEQWPPERSLEGLLTDFTKIPENYFPCVQIQYDFFILCRNLQVYRLKINLFWKQTVKSSVIKANYKVWGTTTSVSKKHEFFHYRLNKETYLVGIDHCRLSPSHSTGLRWIWGWRMWPKGINTSPPKQLPKLGTASLVWSFVLVFFCCFVFR